MMLNIRGMSIVKDFLTGVDRFGHGLTPSTSFSCVAQCEERATGDVSWKHSLGREMLSFTHLRPVDDIS